MNQPENRNFADVLQKYMGTSLMIYHDRGVKYYGEVSDVGSDFVTIISKEHGTTVIPISRVSGVIISDNYNK